MAMMKINMAIFEITIVTVMTLTKKTITDVCRKANGEDLEKCEKEKLEVFGETK